MISLYTLKSANDASQYYQKGDYYTEGGVNEYSQWLGRGAEILKLDGGVDFKTFKDLLEGRLPNGTLMSQTEKGAYHRPGYDLTFSPPKSVSILALVAENPDVLQAHREAVQKTLAYMESKYAGCRNKNKGITLIERTKNFTIATFEHSDSRAGDPSLHTHSVLMNVTQRADGEWRTVFGDEFYTEILSNGKVYDLYLAQGLMQRGYELEFGEKGNFEIKGVPEDLIKMYSKRRAGIENWLEENQLSGSKAAEVANFITRDAKVSVDPKERLVRWVEELKLSGTRLEDLQVLQTIAKDKGPIEPPDPVILATNAVGAAINHLSEWQPTFSFKEVIQSAKKLSLLLTNEGELLKAVEQRIQDKTLLYLENKLLTTVEAINLQQKNIALMKAGKGQVNKILPKWIAELSSHFKANNPKEHKVLTELLTHKDRQILITATSKLRLDATLKNFMELASEQKHYPRVLVQNRASLEALKNKFQTDRVNTIEAFLMACEQRVMKKGEVAHAFDGWNRRYKSFQARDVWIVYQDVSAKQLSRLGDFAKALGARIILTELKNNIPALEPLKKAGIDEIKLRASKVEVQKLSIQAELLKQLKKSERQKHLFEVSDREQRLKLAIEQYSTSTNSALVTLTHGERGILNTLAREHLKNSAELKGAEYAFETLRPLMVSIEEKSQAHFYQPGDRIRFNRAIPNSKIQKESYFEVHTVNLENGLVELHQQDLQVFWSPLENKPLLKHVEVFKKEQTLLQEGEILVWNRTLKNKEDENLDRIKGERAVVTAILQNRAELTLANGHKTILKSEETCEQHWDYGYAMTLKEANSTFLQEAIVVLNGKPLETKYLPLLTELFRAQENKVKVKLFSEDIAAFKQAIEKGGLKPSLTDNAHEIPYKREEALYHYQDLATQPLFNRLQSEYLKINQLNPEFFPENMPLSIDSSAPSIQFRMACDVVDKVCLYHSEREAVLKVEQLKDDAIKLAALSVPVGELEKAFELSLEKGWLISIGDNQAGEALVTPKHTLLMEQMCIEKMKAGQGVLQPILHKESKEITDVKNHSRLTEGQKEAIQLILTTKDRMVAVQGIAGAGKTTALKEINRLCREQDFTMVLANTASAKNQAKTASGLNAKTTAQFLTRLETKLAQDPVKAKQELGGNRLYIVDESSLASTKDAYRLQKVIGQLGARLAWIGDFKQQGSIGAGLNFHDFIAYGIHKAVMQENVRLNSATAFSAMKKAYAGDMGGVLQGLKDSIEEIPNKREALMRVVTAFTALSPIIPEVLVIIPLNKDRNWVNEAIREKLKENDKLSKEGLRVNVFVPTDKREIDRSDIFSYKQSDVIRFNTAHLRLGIEAGDYADIVHIDLKHQRLTLKVENKKEFYWSPKNLAKPSDIEIYQKETRELVEKETIVFKRNQETQGIFNGDKATILKLEKHHADILLSNGSTITLDLNQKQNQHLDYGYALTTYAAQGRDVPFVIAYGEGPKPYEIEASKLKVGDITVLSKGQHEKSEQSKIVEVIKTEQSKSIITISDKPIEAKRTILTLRDREGNMYTQFFDEPNPTQKFIKGLHLAKEKWAYFPPFERRKHNEIPKATSQQSFIIQITRGDGLLLVVPNIDDFQKTLEAHKQLKRSALSYTDPDWQKLHQGVNRLVDNIKGKAEKEVVLKKSPIQHIEKETTLKTIKNTNQYSRYIDKEELNQRLERDMLDYASQWLGSPSSVTGHEARWGSKGSFCLMLQGSKKGLWSNFETEQNGKGLISLYMHYYNVTFKEAIQELSKTLGLVTQAEATLKSLKPAAFIMTSLEKQQALKQQRQAKIQESLEKYHSAIPVAGTLAEVYLREHRKITGELPTDFRFLKADFHLHTKVLLPALVAPYRDKDNNMVGIVRIYLNKDGSQYKATYLDQQGKEVKAASKANKGISSHGRVIVQEGILQKTVWVAEGIETALSIANAVPHQTVVATLSSGQLANLPIDSRTERVVICADNDPASSKTKSKVAAAAEAFLSKGHRVFIALPPEIPPGMKKYDFNDLLIDKGIEAVEKSLHQMIEIKEASVLKTNEPRLETDLNHLRSKTSQPATDHQPVKSQKEINLSRVPEIGREL